MLDIASAVLRIEMLKNETTGLALALASMRHMWEGAARLCVCVCVSWVRTFPKVWAQEDRGSSPCGPRERCHSQLEFRKADTLEGAWSWGDWLWEPWKVRGVNRE